MEAPLRERKGEGGQAKGQGKDMFTLFFYPRTNCLEVEERFSGAIVYVCLFVGSIVTTPKRLDRW